MLDSSQISLLDSLQRQRSYESSTYARTIFCSQDLYRIFFRRTLLCGPVQDLPEGDGAAGFEVGVLVEDGSIGPNMAGLETLLLAYGGNTAGRKAGCSGTDKFG